MVNTSRLLTALLLLLTLGPLAVSAAEEQAEDEFEGEVVVGPQYYLDTDNRDSAKFEEYRDVPNGFVAPSVVLAWRPRPGSFFDLHARDISEDDQRIFVEAGQIDRWRATVHWNENPRRWSDEAFMLHSDTGSNLFTLEDSFQTAVNGAAASTLPGGDANADGEWDAGTKGYVIKNGIASSASSVELGHQRQTGGATFEFTPSRNVTFGLAGERERRRGTMPQSLGMYFALAPAEVAAELDFRTDTAGFSAEFASRRFSVGASALASEFDAGHTSLTWDSQLNLVDAGGPLVASPGHGRMTFATDNKMHRYEVHGAVNLAGRTRIDASFSTSETTQDDPFLPMTINSLLVASPLPAASLDGKYTTTVAQARLSSRPTRALRFGAWWRSYELDNETPSLTFLDYIATDYQFGLCGNVNLPCDLGNDNVIASDKLQRRNLAYGYKRDTAGGLVGWAPLRWFDGSLSYEREDTEREFSAVEEATEDIYKLTLDFDAASWLAVRATARQQERRADEYHAHYLEESFPVGEPVVAAFNEGSRRFYWTDRDRESYGLQLDVSVNEKWSLYGEATTFDDDYFDPETGQPIGSSFTVTEDRNFDTVNETYDILLAGRTNDEGDSYALGVAYNMGPSFDFFADYTIESWEYALATRYRNVSAGIGTDDPLDNWSAAAEDDYETGSLGFHWTIDDARTWKLDGDLSRSEGTSENTTDFVPGGAASGNTTLLAFPEIETTLTVATLRLTRSPRANLDYSLLYWYESWKEDNFASDFNEPYMGDPDEDPGAANWVLLGMDYENYTNHIVSFQMRYHF